MFFLIIVKGKGETMKCIITRASTLNNWDNNGQKHEDDLTTLPCKEAYLEEITDYHGKKHQRYTIDINDLSIMDDIEESYGNKLWLTLDEDCWGYAMIVMLDEELPKNHYWGIPKMYVEMPFPEGYFDPYDPFNPPKLDINIRKLCEFMKTHTNMDITREVYERELKV